MQSTRTWPAVATASGPAERAGARGPEPSNGIVREQWQATTRHRAARRMTPAPPTRTDDISHARASPRRVETEGGFARDPARQSRRTRDPPHADLVDRGRARP